MKLYSLEPQTALIPHPNDPDVKWEAFEPQLTEMIGWQEEWGAAKTTIEKFEKTLELLAKHTKRVVGLQDEQGNPMKLEGPLKPEQLKPFFSHAFDTETEGLVVAKDENDEPIKLEDGSFKLEKGPQRGQFPNYVVDKLFLAETFSRPLESEATHSTSSSTSS